MTMAYAYLRTSSAANADGDSPYCQNDAIMRYAVVAGIEVVACFWDDDVAGSDAIEKRKGFDGLLAAAVANDVRLVIVEDEGRFARLLLTQELGVMLLAAKGIRVVTASGYDMTDGDPAKVMIRQIAGAFSQYEKAKIVQKLKDARQRVINKEGRCGGPDPVPEAHRSLAQRLAAQGMSLRTIAAELTQAGFLAASGKPYRAGSVANMLKPKRRDSVKKEVAA